MRTFKYITIFTFFLFLMGLAHIWSRAEIGKLSYNIYNKKERLQDLFDQRLNLLYNLYKVCSYEEIKEADAYSFAKADSLITIRLARRKASKNSNPSFVERIFGLTRTAQAQD